MNIRVETSKRTGIANEKGVEISAFERNWSAELERRFPNAKRRTDLSASYNCHGLTFASRRTHIFDSPSVNRILSDDDWKEVQPADILPGDIVIYSSDDGDANHSGVVVGEVGEGIRLPLICSKWGNAGEFLHLVNDCPTLYGPITKFYRCRL